MTNYPFRIRLAILLFKACKHSAIRFNNPVVAGIRECDGSDHNVFKPVEHISKPAGMMTDLEWAHNAKSYLVHHGYNQVFLFLPDGSHVELR